MFNSRKKQKARAEQLSNDLVPGAKVMTTFGLFGTVKSISEDGLKVTVESGPGTTLVVHKQAIGQIEAPETAAVEADDAQATGAAVAADDAPADSAAPAVTTADDSRDSARITDEELDAMNAERESATAPGVTTDASQADTASTSTEAAAFSTDANDTVDSEADRDADGTSGPTKA